MGADYNKSVGRRLYEARKAKGYSRAKVGELVGLHETTVKRYEDGDIKSLDIERLKAFAEVLGTSASDLLGWISDSDDQAELMLHLSEENASGRTRAREDMFRLLALITQRRNSACKEEIRSHSCTINQWIAVQLQRCWVSSMKWRS